MSEQTSSSGLSVASLILGIVGVLGCAFWGIGLVPSVAAIITGVMARSRQPLARGFWLTGMITGMVGTVISIVVIIGLIALLLYSLNPSGRIRS